MTWVLVDVSYLAYRAQYSLRGLSHEDYPTGVIYGFFDQLLSLCRDPRVDSNKVALFFDSRKSHRKKAYPRYKQKRVEERGEEELKQIRAMYEQIRVLRTEILPEMGVAVYRQVGLESDDLIAQAAKGLHGPSRKAVIVTADGDLYQCITEGVHWYDPLRAYHDPLTFYAKKGIASEKWGRVKTLAGCSSDNVEGIPGVGEKTAIRYLLGALPSTYKSYKAIRSDKGRKIIKRNKRLVVLPHKKTKPVELREPKYDADAFFRAMERFGIVSYLEGRKRKTWESFFRANGRKMRKRGERRG